MAALEGKPLYKTCTKLPDQIYGTMVVKARFPFIWG